MQLTRILGAQIIIYIRPKLPRLKLISLDQSASVPLVLHALWMRSKPKDCCIQLTLINGPSFRCLYRRRRLLEDCRRVAPSTWAVLCTPPYQLVEWPPRCFVYWGHKPLQGPAQRLQPIGITGPLDGGGDEPAATLSGNVKLDRWPYHAYCCWLTEFSSVQQKTGWRWCKGGYGTGIATDYSWSNLTVSASVEIQSSDAFKMTVKWPPAENWNEKAWMIKYCWTI